MTPTVPRPESTRGATHTAHDKNDLGAAVLCGGRSTRMGRPKALLPFGDETLVERIVRRLSEVAEPVVVAAAPDQDLPVLPATIVRDPAEGRGPLQGIAVALAALAPHCRYAFVCSTDAPFVSAAFVRRLRRLCEGHRIAAVHDGAHVHPLAAVYQTGLHREAQALLDGGHPQARALLDRADTRLVSRDELLADEALRSTDPQLWCLRNLNTPDDYQAALADLGLVLAGITR